MMYLGIVIAAFTALPALALPAQDKLTSSITYFQGGSPENACNIAVASGTMAAGICKQIHVYGIGLSNAPRQGCIYKLFKGSANCNGHATATYKIPKGSQPICINTGVQDGGQFEKASGLWSC
ncbi:hypothetical protein K470DRAFT_254196 [Piedraia hortae CBS 480.64]|uniref:Uncharacterized protein n=1 Tax=Piedraia hortae CBS 480.64 TaxID=1314780 RepID=A0A6A7CAL9_9PEZI|nr:hypothetical protein K470DRAFT_254196 [Piedraia hortae CBS 480.64]